MKFVSVSICLTQVIFEVFKGHVHFYRVLRAWHIPYSTSHVKNTNLDSSFLRRQNTYTALLNTVHPLPLLSPFPLPLQVLTSAHFG